MKINHLPAGTYNGQLMNPIALHDLQSRLSAYVWRHDHRRSIDDRIDFAVKRGAAKKCAPDISVRQRSYQTQIIFNDENYLKG
jgi:hypothetical protein